MSDPINWYQSQRSTVDLWFASVDPTLPAPWRSVMNESSGLVFYWNPETNVSQYEHPNPAPPPPPHPPPGHYQIPYEYKPTFPYSSCNYRPPDYPASYMPEVPVPPSYTSLIFLLHPSPPSVMYSDSIDGPQILHSYAINPNFYDPQIYSLSSYEQTSWVFDSENRLRFNNPHQVSHYELDLGLNSTVHTAPATGNVFSIVRGIRHTSKQSSLKSRRNLAVVSFVRMKRKPPSTSLCRRRYRNRLISSLAPTPPRASANSTTMVDDVIIKSRKQEEFQFRMAEFRKTMTALNNQQVALQEALIEELRLLRLDRVPPNSTMNILDPDLLGMTKSTPTILEFTKVALAPVLHRDGLGKQVTSVTESASSLGVCQDTIQTTMTMISPPFSSPAPLTTTSHFESVEIAPRSERSPDPLPEFGYSPTRPLSMSSLQPPPHLPLQIRSSPPSKLQDHHVPPLLLSSPLLTAMATPLVNPHSTVSAVAIIPFPNFEPAGVDILPKNSKAKVAGLLQPEDQDDIITSEYGDHQSFKLKNIKNSGPEVFPCLSHSSANLRAILHSLLNAQYSAFLNDKYGWVILYLVGKFVKMDLTTAELFDEMSKRQSDGIIETIFSFMSHSYHLQWLIPCCASNACAKYLTIFEPLLCCNFTSQPKLRNLDTSTIGLHLAFYPLLTILLEFQLVWDPGHAFCKLSYAAFALVFSFRSKWMRLDHGEFEVFVLSCKQGFTFSSEISLVEFLNDANAYVLPMSLTSFRLPIFVASELVKEKYSCYFQKFLPMPFSLAVGTEPLDGLFTINSNPFQLETFENMLVTWVTQPIARFLLDGMHYHGVLNMAFLSASQRLLQVIVVISKYMSPLLASYLAYANQIHVVLAFYIDGIGIITDFGKHFDGDEYVSCCHFNAKYNVDLMAALFMAHTTHVRLMERHFPDPTTSLPPAQVLPPVFILVLCLVSHFHVLESDHIYLGKSNQVPVTDINCMHNWLNGNVLHVATWVGEAIVFLSLHIWNEILRSNFVLVDPFHHHGIWRVTLANMITALDSAIWFSVYKGFTIIGWNLFTALVRVNMIHILYGEGIEPSLSRSVWGSNKTEWKRNDYLIRFFTYIFQSNESPVIWFFKSEMSLTAGIRPVCSVVYRMTNIFGGVPNCFVYWMGLSLCLQHKMINYGMLCTNSLLYLKDYQTIQSSIEFCNRGEISSNSFGVLLNNNWPSLTNLEIFNGFVTSYFPYYFWTSNLFTEHDAEAFEYDEETCILLDHSPVMLLSMKWVPIFLAIFNSIYLPHELVVGDATRLIVLVFSVFKISVLQLFYSISKYLARLHDFILAGSELLIFVFWVNTLKMFWKNMVCDLKPHTEANTEYEYGTPFDKLAGLFPDCCMLLSRF